MANLTITVDDEVLKRARIRAIEQGTSVNAMLAEHLRAFAGQGEAQVRATSTLISLAKSRPQQPVTDPAERREHGRWSREDLHER